MAEQALLKSISLRNNVYENHYHLATLYYSTNELEKAVEQYEISIKLRPDSAEALNNLAYLYTELNTNSKKALEMAKTANQIEPNNSSYLDTLGWAYYRNGDLENALLYLQKANNLLPGQSEILLHIGRIFLEKNEFDNALTFVKEAFKANPNLDDPDETLYLTIRLKALNESLANYHGILGEKADKEKVLKILKSISDLYQENGLYDKSIEITKICSSLSKDEISLNEPLLASYKLLSNNKKDVTKQDKVLPQPPEGNKEEKTSEPSKEQQDSSRPEDQEKTSAIPVPEIKPEDAWKHLLVKDADCPFAITICSEFFKTAQQFLPNLKELANCNVTIFMDRFLFPGKTAFFKKRLA